MADSWGTPVLVDVCAAFECIDGALWVLCSLVLHFRARGTEHKARQSLGSVDPSVNGRKITGCMSTRRNGATWGTLLPTFRSLLYIFMSCDLVTRKRHERRPVPSLFVCPISCREMLRSFRTSPIYFKKNDAYGVTWPSCGKKKLER